MNSEHEIYEYVREAFLRVERGFRTSDRVAVEMATGTGKSCVIELLIQAHENDRILFLTSGVPLLKDFQEKVKAYGPVPYLMTGIYPSFKAEKKVRIKGTSTYDTVAYKELDWLILDEYHALGAEGCWHEYQNLLLNNPHVKVLGLTATPVRSDGQDMCAKIFHGNCVYKLDIETAMKKQILGRPKYYVCHYQNDDLHEVIEELGMGKDLPEASFIQKAKRALANSKGMEHMFQQIIGSRQKGKYMVFCCSNEHMMEMIQQCKERWFLWEGDIGIYYQTAMQHPKNDYDAFVKDNTGRICLFFSVDQFNQGVHNAKLEGLIFFRPTASFRIFSQQYGRLMKAYDLRETVVLDVVQNCANLHYFHCLYSDENKTEAEKEPWELRGSFHVISVDEKVDRVLAEIRAYQNSHLSWEDAYALAKEYFIEHGHLRVPKDTRIHGFNLYQWINEQRYYRWHHSRRSLDPYQIEKLNRIGMDWDPANGQWLENWEIVREWAKENDIQLLTRETAPVNGLNIYRWVHKQRMDYRRGSLSTRQVELLQEIGIYLDYITPAKNEEYLEILEAYIRRTGGVEGLNQEEPLTYRWLHRQMAIACGEAKGRLNHHLRESLEDFGIHLDTRRQKTQRMIEQIEEFTRTHRRLPREEEKEYYGVKEELSRKLSMGKLEKEQERRLINLGMKIKQRSSRKRLSMEQKMAAAIAYRKAKPNEKVTRSTSWEGVSLGEIYHSLQKKQREELNEQELELLDRLMERKEA